MALGRTQPTVARTGYPQDPHPPLRVLRWAVTSNMTSAGRRGGDFKPPHRVLWSIIEQGADICPEVRASGAWATPDCGAGAEEALVEAEVVA